MTRLRRCSLDPLSSRIDLAVTWTATTADPEEVVDASNPEFAHLFQPEPARERARRWDDVRGARLRREIESAETTDPG
jgi:hypothetical protein